MSNRRTLRIVGFALALLVACPRAQAKDGAGAGVSDPVAPAASPAPHAPMRVTVQPPARDEAIARRLKRILRATGWFAAPDVRVDEGVVFLAGRARNEARLEWATHLGRSTEGVVAVVNQMTLEPVSAWDFSWTTAELERLARTLVWGLPLLLVWILWLVSSWWLARLATIAVRHLLRNRVGHELLLRVVAGACGVLTFLLGVYFVLRVSGLTRLAVSVLGGTGVAGLVIGIAFRDIAENLLASVLLSIHRPFRTGDLIEVAGVRGFVRHLSIRSTTLLTLESRLVQIPNSIIYKTAITNFWANPTTRLDFTVGIGYADEVERAQAVGLEVMRTHEAVLADPEPLVLVDALSAATVNLRFYFWIDIRRFSDIKVRSAIMRIAKRAFQDASVSMPDESREVLFPDGVTVRLQREPAARSHDAVPEAGPPRSAIPLEPAQPSPEGSLGTEADEIAAQTRTARTPEASVNLLGDGQDP